MKSAPKELEALLSNPSFVTSHEDCGTAFDADVRRFLVSSMDEVRTATSSRIALTILETIGISDFGKFRETVLRRELLGEIVYLKQRDHSSHTIYNYLLGWYVFLHCPKLQQVLQREFKKRGVIKGALLPFSSNSQYFSAVWQYASILHDVGYMFEGGLETLDFRDSSEQAEIGARVARNYFNRDIWVEYNIDSVAKRSAFFTHLSQSPKPPPFDRINTLGEIADELRCLGDLDPLLYFVRKTFDTGDTTQRGPILKEFSGDAFELWAEHYERFGHSVMAARINSLRKVFNVLIDEGIPDRVRLLDHGVCGGLLQLLATTYYYRLYAAAENAPTPKHYLVEQFLAGKKWSPKFWWTGIVWATAAVAVHNIQQMSSATQLDTEWPGKLAISDDPLAYLGVLVDIIQEWDRYSVFKAPDREPIQGSEVELGKQGGKIMLHFNGPSGAPRARKLRENLDAALVDWRKLVDVGPRTQPETPPLRKRN